MAARMALDIAPRTIFGKLEMPDSGPLGLAWMREVSPKTGLSTRC
jgi:hypothetical protein